jgi:hypothetical protein
VRDVPAEDNTLAAKRAVWDLQTVTAVTARLRKTTETGDHVLSWWEGYPVLSGRRSYDGVGFWEANVAKKISPADAQRYHVLQRTDLESLVARREPRAVVVADGEWDYLRPALAAARYTPAHRVGAVAIYVPSSGS